jgi:folate-dependent phosphoribosylglycinamide formyltransferase PurN
MGENTAVVGRPIRVVVFTSGPTLGREVAVFLARLEEHPEIELTACYCQSDGQSISDLWANYWKRRRILAIPLLLNLWLGNAFHWLSHPKQELGLRRTIAALRKRIFFVNDIHAEQVCRSVAAQKAYLGLIYGAPILKPALFEIPAMGTIGIHHGTLPGYRGKKTTFWEIYNGEKTAGVTIQKVNAGLDTGEIIRQGTVAIGRRSYGWVFNQIIQLGYDIYIQSILDVKHGIAVYQPQTGNKNRLCKDPRPSDFVRLWLRWFQRIANG